MLEFGVRVSYSSNDIVFVVIHYKHLTVRRVLIYLNYAAPRQSPGCAFRWQALYALLLTP